MYSQKIASLQPPFTRQILEFSKQKGVISFAGGLPLEKFLQYQDFQKMYNTIIKKHKAKVFQYAPTNGLLELRKKIPKLANLKNFNENNILITSGSSEALDIVCRAFLEPNDTVMVQNPTYLSALKLFELYEAKIEESPKNPKLHYIITKFHNPTNKSWTKKTYIKYQEKHKSSKTIVVEDNPYMMLDSKKEYDNITNYLPKTGIAIGSFSKSVAPDFRLGYIAANEEFIDKFTQIKSIINLQSSYLPQYIVNEWIQNGGFEKHVAKVSSVYYEKSKYFIDQAKEIFQEKIECKSDIGGMFAWIKFKEIDTQDLFNKAYKKGVIFIPGCHFFIDGQKPCSFARFNFTNMSKTEIRKGLFILHKILKKM